MNEIRQCDVGESLALDYVLDELSPGARADFVRHLQRCSACRALVTSYRAMRDELAMQAVETDTAEAVKRIQAGISGRHASMIVGWPEFIHSLMPKVPAWGISLAAHLLIIFSVVHIVYHAARSTRDAAPSDRGHAITLRPHADRQGRDGAQPSREDLHRPGRTPSSHGQNGDATPPREAMPVPIEFDRDPVALQPVEPIGAVRAMDTLSSIRSMPQDIVNLSHEVLESERGSLSIPPIYRGRVDPILKARLLRDRGGAGAQEMIQGGLAYLASKQQKDGSWDVVAEGGQARYATGVHALILLSFLGDGHTHSYGRYAEVVRRGIHCLLLMQDRDTGRFGPDNDRLMYGHAIATSVLAEDFMMTGNKDGTLRRALEKAVDFLIQSQGKDYGWGYRQYSGHSDTSVTTWVLLALHAAGQAGLDVSAQAIANAGKWYDTVRKTDGSIAYMAAGADAQGRAGPTASALAARLIAGVGIPEDGIAAARDYLLDSVHAIQGGRGNRVMWHHGSMAMCQLGGRAWQRWNARMRQFVERDRVTTHERQGAWALKGRFADAGGRFYTTAISVLTLETYYRFGPVARG